MAEEESTADENELNIARRTRSHLKIDDCGLNLDNLDFPDVERDLYNPDSEADPEYRNFLYECYRSADIRDDTNTDDNDPAYVYNDDIFCPGWALDLDEELRQNNLEDPADKAVIDFQLADPTIGDTNHNQHELFTLQNATPQMAATASTSAPTDGFKSPFKANRRGADVFSNPELTRILNQQLRQHIQLLTQTYLLTKNTTNMKDAADEAKSHLNSYMKIFKSRAKPSNLLPALDLVNNLATPKDIKSSIRLSWRPLPVPESVRTTIKSNRRVFIYPSLMPQVAFSFLPEKLADKKPKINFTLNEDKLLTYALHEFKGESSPYAFIASLLMTAKTKTQISNHIKNIKRSPGNENNPIKLYYNNGQLPKIDLDEEVEELAVEEAEEAAAVSVANEELQQPPQQTHEPAVEEPQVQVNQEPRDEQQVEEEDVEEDVEDDVEDDEVVEEEDEDEEEVVEEEEDEEEEEEVEEEDEEEEEPAGDECKFEERTEDDLMNMDLDDLMAASSTISKTPTAHNNNDNNNISDINHNNNNHSNNNNNNNTNGKRNIKLKNSMLNMMSHKFSLTRDMGDLMIYEFLRQARASLNERDHLHLLQLLTDLMKKEAAADEAGEAVVAVYEQISGFLSKVEAPAELAERVVLFLTLEQANKCGCALSYLHWMRFFEFIQHVELYHDDDGFEKKLARLIDALQRDDPHKVKLATANLISKHPELRREFESLALDGKPDPSLFACEASFDDITEPMSMFGHDNHHHQPPPHPAPETTINNNNNNNNTSTQASLVDLKSEVYQFEHFNSKVTKEELNYATKGCPCDCHTTTTATSNGQCCPSSPIGQHCGRCNLKFMKGRMYIVNKIKPILAEWSYATTPPPPPPPPPALLETSPNKPPAGHPAVTTPPTTINNPPIPIRDQHQQHQQPLAEWTFEEDKEILEFCRAKAEQNEETVSFDSNTFEELVNLRKRRQAHWTGDSAAQPTASKKSARQIADRFNHLMEIATRADHSG